MTSISFHDLHWVDYVFIGLVTLSTIVSIVRGFVREAISLATWILAFWLGIHYAPELAAFFKAHVSNPTVRMVIGFAIVFIAVLLVGALINHLISSFITKTGLSSTDRVLGVFFGIARGVLLVGVIVLMVQLTSAEKSDAWRHSALVPHLQGLATWLQGFLPEKFTQMTHHMGSQVSSQAGK